MYTHLDPKIFEPLLSNIEGEIISGIFLGSHIYGIYETFIQLQFAVSDLLLDSSAWTNRAREFQRYDGKWPDCKHSVLFCFCHAILSTAAVSDLI